MLTRTITIVLSSAMAASAPAITQALPNIVPDAMQESGAPLSAMSLEQAAASGKLDTFLTQAVGTHPSPERLATLEGKLRLFSQTNPAAAATALASLSRVATNLAPNEPQTAISLVEIILSVLDGPGVMEANHQDANQALVSSSAAIAQARKAADSSNTQLLCARAVDAKSDDPDLPCDERLLNFINLLAGDDQDLLDQIALAQLNPGGFVTAAGPNPGPEPESTSSGSGPRPVPFVPYLPPTPTQPGISRTSI